MYATTQIVAKLKIPQWSKNLNFTDFQFFFLYSLKKNSGTHTVANSQFLSKNSTFQLFDSFSSKIF